jgi:predicted peptidase
MKVRWLFLIFVVITVACARKPVVEIPVFSQEIFLTRNVSFGSEQFRFRIFVPKDKKAGEKLPVMLYFHGADERGDDNEGQLSGPAADDSCESG